MISGGISITTDTATPMLNRLALALRRKEYRPAVGQAGVRVLMDHFADKNMDMNSHKTAERLGAQPTQLFAEFAKATSFSTHDRGITLSVTHPAARQRYHGGIVEPQNVTYLTIANTAAAYGRSAREFGDLLAVMFGRDRTGVVRPVALVDKDDRTSIYYWLVTSVTQPQDRSVLPNEDTLREGILEALRGWLKRIKGAPNG